MNKSIICTFCALAFTLLCATSYADTTISLNGKWNLSFWKQPVTGAVITPEGIAALKVQTIPATVPGNVEIDLEAAGIIPDPLKGMNILQTRQYEGYQWCYSRSFPTPALKADQKLQLTFNGLDCLATVWLNGKLVGSPENMFIEHRFDITSFVRPGGTNELKVIIRSAVIEAQKYLVQSITGRNDEEAFIRKAPSQYGWDIVPRIVSAGLWRGVELNVLEPAGFEDVNWVTLMTDPATGTAQIYMFAQMRLPHELYGIKLDITLTRNGKKVYSNSKNLNKHTYRDLIDLENVDFWWPRGYGEAALYEAVVRLKDENGKTLAENKQNIGIRTVKFDMTDVNLPEAPGRYCFIVNGEKIFARGTNWVPLDALPSRGTLFCKSTLDFVIRANCNMLRVWGGSVYEDHEFFDICDREGVMVWQDFMLSCAIYPNSPEFQKAMYEEARSVVIKLRNHPSLAIWCGGNETDDVIFYQRQLYRFNVDPNRDKITREVFPDVLYQYDPSRPYLPSSPYITPEVFARWDRTKSPHSMKDIMPEVHLWGERGYYKEPFYSQCPAQFVSEIGFHGCPNRSSLERMLDKDYLYPWPEGDFKWNPQWQLKAVDNNPSKDNKSHKRNSIMLNQIELLFGKVPTDLDEFIYASQCNQAEAIKYNVELWRSSKFDKSGILWWDIRDSWPIFSNAAVDYYNTPKRMYYYMSNVQHNVCVLVLDAVKGAYPLMAVNDTRTEIKGATVEVSDVVSGKQLYKGKFDILVNGKTTITSLPEQKGQGILLIKYTVDGIERLNHYLYGKPPFALNDYRAWINKTGIYNDIKETK